MLDSCCAITLEATGQLANIVAALPVAVLLPGYALRNELRREVPHDGIEHSVTAGHLGVAELDPAEMDTFVDLCALALGDGEAACGALASTASGPLVLTTTGLSEGCGGRRDRYSRCRGWS